MTCVRQEADLSCAELGAESPDGARKNSARLSRRRENPRFKHTLRMVLKSGLESRTHITTLIHTPAGALTHRTSRGRVPVQHVPGLVQQSDGDNVVFRQPTRLSRRQQPSVCLCISVCVCVCACARSHLVGERVLVVSQQVSDQRAPGGGLHLGPDPAQLLLQLQQGQVLLERHAGHRQTADKRLISPYFTSHKHSNTKVQICNSYSANVSRLDEFISDPVMVDGSVKGDVPAQGALHRRLHDGHQLRQPWSDRRTTGQGRRKQSVGLCFTVILLSVLPSPRRCWMLDRYCCWTSGGARGDWEIKHTRKFM